MVLFEGDRTTWLHIDCKWFVLRICLCLEIVRRVEKVERPPFRPVVQDSFASQEIMFVMRSCWAEAPAERLKFAQVRSVLRQLSKYGSIALPYRNTQ